MSNGVRSALKVQQAEPAPAPRVSVRSAPRVQPSSLRLSQPGDAGEREADRVAGQVMAMPDGLAHGGMIAARERIPLLAARAPTGSINAASGENVASDVASEIRSLAGSGTPLRTETRRFMEPRFRANFSDVRVHTGGKAASLASRLGAAAFTHGRDVVFGKGAYRPESDEGKRLIAHELTHTIQQGGASGRVHRSVDTAPVTVQERSGLQVQRGIVSRALDWIADKANYIPGFRLLTIVIGRNPINMAAVDRSGENILRAMIEFIPGGPKIAEALQNHGVLQKGGKFIEAQFAALADLGGSIRDALMQFVDSLGLTDLASPGDVWERAKRIFTAPVDRAIAFGRNLVSGIAEIVKEAIIKPLGAWAKSNVPKWDLLVGVFGKNPISEEGESPASALIGAFMELIGQGEIWENIKKGNAVARAWQWFQTAMKGAKALVTGIPGRVVATIRSLTIFDIVTIVGAFAKIAGAFGSFVGDFMRWAGGTVLNLLEIILSVVAPAVVPYLKKAGGAFSTIIRNPMGFVRTLVAAGKAGFNQFAGNFLEHLKASLIGWLTGAMGGAGIYIPQGLNFREILKFALSVMGLTWNNIRAKLVAATNETTVKALETGFDLVKTLVTEGPAAAWQQLMETLSNLKQMAIDAVMDFVKSRVVQAAVTKLLSMLSPAGAFIQAIIAIYNTVMFFVERLRQIAAVAASFIDGIAAIAAGNIAPAAARVERTLAGLLTLVISFLARIAGLGKVSDAVIGLINKIRAPLDKALDKVVAWIVGKAKALGTMILQAGVPNDPLKRTQLAIRDAKIVAKGLGGKPLTQGVLETALSAIKTRYSLSALRVFRKGKSWWASAEINPKTAEEIAQEKAEDLAKRIRVIADSKVNALKLKRTKGEGTHESPIVMPAGSGIVTIAKKLDQVPLARGKIVVVDTAQGSKSDQRAVVQRPAFGDAIVSGATSGEKRVEIGKYAKVVEEIRKRFGANDAKSAAVIFSVLQGMPIPDNMKEHSGWIGGLKTLAAQEIRRDAVAAITLPANIALAEAGKKDLDQVFINSVRNRAGTGSTGGDFSQSVVGANAIMRGVREQTGLDLPANAPATRGTAANRAGAIAVDAATVTELAKLRLKSKHEPSNDEIAGVVEEEIQKVMK